MSLYELSLTRREPNRGGCFTPNRTTAWRFLRGANGPVKTKRRQRTLQRTRFAAGHPSAPVTLRHLTAGAARAAFGGSARRVPAPRVGAYDTGAGPFQDGPSRAPG